MRTLYDLAAGILLTGGGDIDPALYGQEPNAKLVDVQADRDQEEITISRWAAADAKPLLGICRGVQVMAVAAGGTLCQDLPSLMPEATLHNYAYCTEGSNAWDYIAHEVELTPSCRLSQILQTRRLGVNSLHHQAVESIPEPFQIVGRSSDGVVEVIELPGHPFYCGVQWHPEILVAEHETARRIFRGFVEVCEG
jgi:putative glutamine amidotransferase